MSPQKQKRAYWCDSCHVPLIGERCLACGRAGRDLTAANLVPAFQPELNYIKHTADKALHPYLKELETWVMQSRYTYYVQGTPILKLSGMSRKAEALQKELQFQPINRNKSDRLSIIKAANIDYVKELQYEAECFIRETVKKNEGKTVLVSFSGGKDSTVTSHLVMSALGRSDLLHIFSDTTIEFPDTYKYIQDFQQQHPLTPFIATKSPLDFFDTAEKIGPPSRIRRWCCTTHKTNPIAKLINSMSPDRGVLTFEGVRASESPRRSNYPRISKHHKIAREVLARPILKWTDLQIWLYLLFHEIPFNQAYRKSFRRVGCLYCPFNSDWSYRMTKHRYPKHYAKWEKFLTNQAEKMQHPNPTVFVEKGWRVRAGGKGLDHYKAQLESAPCMLAENAISYQLLSGDIKLVRSFLKPFGQQSFINKDDWAESFLILGSKENEVLASVEVSFQDRAVRINYLVDKYKKRFIQRVEKQLKKLQSCIYCGACGAKCTRSALNSDGNYKLDESKCNHCLSCVSHSCPIVKSLHYKGSR